MTSNEVRKKPSKRYMILKSLAGIEIIREKLLPYLKDKNLTEEQRNKILKVISILDDILYSDDI